MKVKAKEKEQDPNHINPRVEQETLYKIIGSKNKYSSTSKYFFVCPYGTYLFFDDEGRISFTRDSSWVCNAYNFEVFQGELVLSN